ncbi:MAG TPA: DUF4383 domain-containing protein [Mycobacterium sp.]|nr:DUF4383 domain-containing protein [Mycobacterium sp.]
MASKPKYMAVQAAALLVGSVLVVVGLLGFIPGITTDYDRLEWAGRQSEAKLFGVFVVSGLHNLVHLALGVLGFAMARSYGAARAYFLGGGLVYLALWVHGLLIDHGGTANIIPVNGAGNWLHFGLGVSMVLLGLTLAGQRDPTKRRTRIRA